MNLPHFIYHIHRSIGHFSGFHILAVMSSAAMTCTSTSTCVVQVNHQGWKILGEKVPYQTHTDFCSYHCSLNNTVQLCAQYLCCIRSYKSPRDDLF
jgi:hypothetical protein